MSVIINNEKYYRTAEVIRLVSISRSTLFNWLKRGILGPYELRDRHGWRLFTYDEIETLKKKANETEIIKR
jgi:predicted site-specific integrase-resolvase